MKWASKSFFAILLLIVLRIIAPIFGIEDMFPLSLTEENAIFANNDSLAFEYHLLYFVA